MNGPGEFLATLAVGGIIGIVATAGFVAAVAGVRQQLGLDKCADCATASRCIEHLRALAARQGDLIRYLRQLVEAYSLAGGHMADELGEGIENGC